MHLEYRSLKEVAQPELLRTADLLLWRRLPRDPSIVRRLIARAGRGDHYHAGKVSWTGFARDVVVVLETRAMKGGRTVSLSSQVRKCPGQIDVYRTNPNVNWPEYDRFEADRLMRRLASRSYGWWGLAQASLLHLPAVRWFVRAAVDDEHVTTRPPFCSHACAWADRVGGGVDPVPHLADRLTEPADLARSQFYEYRFTLVP